MSQGSVLPEWYKRMNGFPKLGFYAKISDYALTWLAQVQGALKINR